MRSKKGPAARASSEHLWAVFMAGGSGTRFWPESRADLPKQFLTIFGKKTLLEQTVDRLSPVIPRSRVLVVTKLSKAAHVRKLLKLPASQIIGEPVGRNTAPCAALAAEYIHRKDPDAVLALLPSDHKIGKEPLYRGLLAEAARQAGRHRMPVTFGIKPSSAHTGYGYLELGRPERSSSKQTIYRLKSFREKPSAVKAKEYFRSKRFLWNSGMFVWRADDLLKAVQIHQPAISGLLRQMKGSRVSDFLKKHFKKMPSVSMDYGLMEPLKGKILTLPADIDWSDLGGWLSFEGLWPCDAAGNFVSGQSVCIRSNGNIIKSGNKMVALLGVKDLVVINTDDALLVCPKSETENIRAVVSDLQNKKLTQYL